MSLLESQFSSELDEDSEIELRSESSDSTKKPNCVNIQNIAVACIRYGICLKPIASLKEIAIAVKRREYKSY